MIGASFQRVLAGAVAGDEQCFALIWRDLQPALLRYLRMVVARGAADDVASETWLDVVQTLGRFRGDEQGFRAWVFTIARHRALDWQRRAIRQQALLGTELLVPHTGPDDPAAAAMETLSTEAALALLAGLPQAQAEVVLLRVVVGLDVAQVARIVGKPPGTVRVLVHRGLRRLAKQLAADAPRVEA
jgi:RNA polymerase sigma-70 factor (ECF subfamily)